MSNINSKDNLLTLIQSGSHSKINSKSGHLKFHSNPKESDCRYHKMKQEKLLFPKIVFSTVSYIYTKN